MPTPYTGAPGALSRTSPVTIQVPVDADSPNAASVGQAPKALADLVAHTRTGHLSDIFRELSRRNFQAAISGPFAAGTSIETVVLDSTGQLTLLGQRLGTGSNGLASGFEPNPPALRATTGAGTPNQYIDGFAYSGSVFVAIGSTSNGRHFWSSPDAITWTMRNSGAGGTGYGAGVVWCASSGLFVASGPVWSPGGWATSPDGITWTNRTGTPGATIGLMVAIGNVIVAIANDRTGSEINATVRQYVARSTDGGITFSETQPLPVSHSFLGKMKLIPFPGGSLICVCVNDGAGAHFMFTSPDGITWTKRTNIGASPTWSFSWDGQYCIAWPSVAGGQPWLSTDGITWTKMPLIVGINVRDAVWHTGRNCYFLVGTGNQQQSTLSVPQP